MVKKKRQSDPQNKDEYSTDSDDKPTNNSNSPIDSPGGVVVECQHVKRSLDLQKLRKLYKTTPLDMNNCGECLKKSPQNTEEINGKFSEDMFEFDRTLWLCLKCGTHLCGRAKNQHALEHFETPRSDSHALVINTTTFSLWCYACDEEVNCTTKKQLSETVDFVKKLTQRQQAIVPQIITPTEGQTIDDSGLTDHLKLKLNSNNSVNNSSSPNSTPIPGMARRIQTTTMQGSSISTFPIDTLPRVRGLSNLGNTCFFNAVLQCLAQTPFLLEVLHESSEAGERFTLPGGEFKFKDGETKILPAIEGVLSEWGELTSSLADALEQLQSGGSVFNPSKLFNKLTTKCPQFRGGDQHDSHELLRHLLERVRSEDLKRYQKVILNELGYNSQITPGDDMKQKCKIYGQQAQDRILRPEQVFRGFLVSTLTCQDCFYTSSRHESFLDMSLPVSVEKPPPPIRRRTSPETSPNSTTLSKHQLKKEKEKERKAKRAAKHHNKKLNYIPIGPIGDNMDDSIDTNNTSLNNKEIENSRSSDSSSSEQSDADIEDNLIDDIPKNGQSLLHLQKACDTNGNSETPNSPEKRGDSPENPNKDSNDDENDSGIATSPANPTTSMDLISSANTSLTRSRGGSTELNNSMECNGSSNLILNLGINKNASLVRNRSLELNQKENLERNLEKLNLSDDDIPNDAKDNKNILDIKKKKAKQKRIRTQSYSDWNTTIAPRYQCDAGECSIQSCLNNFTAVELMTGNNKVGCDACTKRINGEGENVKSIYTNATKQFLISSPPAVLILHLKRFQVGQRCLFSKLTRPVSFPVVLDIAPFCGSKVKNLPNIDRKQKKLLYALYGIVEHSGSMYGGHYTAYVKVRPKLSKSDKRWKFMPQGSKAELDQTDEQKAKLDELLAKEKAREQRMKSNDSDDFTSSNTSSDSDDRIRGNEVSDVSKPLVDLSDTTECEGAVGGALSNNTEEQINIEAPPGKWYYVSDSRVQEVLESAVLKAQAYLLFYERIY
ncbi:ubiquitin carboxyl-terminal hydrolase 45 [Condylostylus longicornis]|uniref:ubiquitin carboxyl-terminal hydrolase 45 n=1 Tax=Condylostylus longicornis TaxID=2530218 RepID=UPI00244E272D|nr:ubiquitin carboxyl-terminal hydrolase 45 [Condylostylus longicornis]